MSFHDLLNGISQIQSDGNLRSVMDQFVNVPGVFHPNADIVETDDNVFIYMEVPGVIDSSINVDFFNNKITIGGEKIKNYADSEAYKTEIIYGTFTRNLTIPISVTNKQNVCVTCNNGVLTIAIDKKSEEEHKFRVNISPNVD